MKFLAEHKSREWISTSAFTLINDAAEKAAEDI